MTVSSLKQLFKWYVSNFMVCFWSWRFKRCKSQTDVSSLIHLSKKFTIIILCLAFNNEDPSQLGWSSLVWSFILFSSLVLWYLFNLLQPKFITHFLRTVLYTFPKVLKRRICLTIKSFFSWWSFLLFSWPWCVILGWYCKEKFHVFPS